MGHFLTRKHRGLFDFIELAASFLDFVHPLHDYLVVDTPSLAMKRDTLQVVAFYQLTDSRSHSP